MIRFLKTAVLAVLLGLGTLAAVPATASADPLRIEINNGTRHAQSRDWEGRRHHGRDHHRDGRRHRACSAERAVEKAWRMGINRPQVTRVNRNTIRVAGFQRGHHVRVLFARAPNCPVIR